MNQKIIKGYYNYCRINSIKNNDVAQIRQQLHPRLGCLQNCRCRVAKARHSTSSDQSPKCDQEESSAAVLQTQTPSSRDNVAYLSSDNIAYLVDVFKHVPRSVDLQDHAIPPQKGDHRAHKMEGSAHHALAWAARRFGHMGASSSPSHQQAVAPDGIMMFAGTGTLGAVLDNLESQVLGSGAYTMWCYGSDSSAQNRYALAAGFNDTGGCLGNGPTGTKVLDASPFRLNGAVNPLSGTRAEVKFRFRGTSLAAQSSKGAAADYTQCVAPGCRAVPLSPVPYYFGVGSADAGMGHAGSDFLRFGMTAWRFCAIDDGSGQYTIQNVGTLGYLSSRDAPSTLPSTSLVETLDPGFVPCYPTPQGCLAHYTKAFLTPLLPLAPLRKWVLYKDGSVRWTPMSPKSASGGPILLKNVRTAEYLCLVDDNPLFGFLTTSPSSTGKAPLFSLEPVTAGTLPSGIVSIDQISLSANEAREYLEYLANGTLPRVPFASNFLSKWTGFFESARSPGAPTGYKQPYMVPLLLDLDKRAEASRLLAVRLNDTKANAFRMWATGYGTVTGQILRPDAGLSAYPDNESGFMEWFKGFGRCFFDTYSTDAKRNSVSMWVSEMQDTILHDPPILYKAMPRIGANLFTEIVYANQTTPASVFRMNDYNIQALNAIGDPARYRPVGSSWVVRSNVPTTLTVRFSGDVCVAGVFVLLTAEAGFQDAPCLALSGVQTSASVTTTLQKRSSDGTVSQGGTSTQPLNMNAFEPPNVRAARAPFPDSAYKPPISDWSWVFSLETLDGIGWGFAAAIGRVGPPLLPWSVGQKTFTGVMPLSAPAKIAGQPTVLLPSGGFTGEADQLWWFKPRTKVTDKSYLILSISDDPKATAIDNDNQPGRKWLALTLSDFAQIRSGQAQVGKEAGQLAFAPYVVIDSAGSATHPWTLEPYDPNNSAQRWQVVKSPSNGRVLQCDSMTPFPQISSGVTGFVNSAYGAVGEPPVVANEATVTLNVPCYVFVSDVVFVAGDPAITMLSHPASELSDQKVLVYGQPSSENWVTLWTKDARPMTWSPTGYSALTAMTPTGDTPGIFFATKTQNEWTTFAVTTNPAGKSLVGQYRTERSSISYLTPLSYPYYVNHTHTKSSHKSEAVTNSGLVLDVFHSELRRRLSNSDGSMAEISLDSSDDEDAPAPQAAQVPPFAAAAVGAAAGAAAAVLAVAVPAPAPAVVPTPVQAAYAEAAAQAAAAANRQRAIAQQQAEADAEQAAVLANAVQAATNATLASTIAAQAAADNAAGWADLAVYNAPPPLPNMPPALLPSAVNPNGGMADAPLGQENLLMFLGTGIAGLFGSLENLFPSPGAAHAGGGAAAAPVQPEPGAAWAVIYQLTIVTGAIGEAYNAAWQMMMRLQVLLERIAAGPGQANALSVLFFLSPFTQFFTSSGGMSAQSTSGMVPGGTGFTNLQVTYRAAISGAALGPAVAGLLRNPLAYAGAQARTWMAANSFFQSVLAGAATLAAGGAAAAGGRHAPSTAQVRQAFQNSVDELRHNAPLPFPERWPHTDLATQGGTPFRRMEGHPSPQDAANSRFRAADSSAFQVSDTIKARQAQEAYHRDIRGSTNLNQGGPVEQAPAMDVPRGSEDTFLSDLQATPLLELLFRGNATILSATPGSASTNAPQGHAPIVTALFDMIQIGTWFELNANPAQFLAAPPHFALLPPQPPAQPALDQTSQQISALFQSYLSGAQMAVPPPPPEANPQDTIPGFPPFMQMIFQSWSQLLPVLLYRLNPFANIGPPAEFFAGTGTGHGGMAPMGGNSVSVLLAFIAGIIAGISPPWHISGGGSKKRRLAHGLQPIVDTGDGFFVVAADELHPKGIQSIAGAFQHSTEGHVELGEGVGGVLQTFYWEGNALAVAGSSQPAAPKKPLYLGFVSTWTPEGGATQGASFYPALVSSPTPWKFGSDSTLSVTFMVDQFLVVGQDDTLTFVPSSTSGERTRWAVPPPPTVSADPPFMLFKLSAGCGYSNLGVVRLGNDALTVQPYPLEGRAYLNFTPGTDIGTFVARDGQGTEFKMVMAGGQMDANGEATDIANPPRPALVPIADPRAPIVFTLTNGILGLQGDIVGFTSEYNEIHLGYTTVGGPLIFKPRSDFIVDSDNKFLVGDAGWHDVVNVMTQTDEGDTRARACNAIHYPLDKLP